MNLNDEDVVDPDDGMGGEIEPKENPNAALELVKLLHGRGPCKRRDNELLAQLTELLE